MGAAFSQSMLRQMRAFYDRLMGLAVVLPCSCLFGGPRVIGCPTHDPGQCDGIDAMREEAIRKRRVEVAVSQVAELVDAECVGAEMPDGDVLVTLVERERRRPDLIGQRVEIRLRDERFAAPVVVAVVALAQEAT